MVLCVGTYSAYFPKQVTIESSLRINNMLNNVEEKPKSQFVKPYLRSEEQEDTTNSADNVSLTKEERVEKTNRKRREQLLSHNDKAQQRLKDIEDMHANKHVTGVQPDGIDDTVTSIVECETTQGPLTVDVRAGWSPNGANQFIKLVDLGHFTDLPFNRVCPKYVILGECQRSISQHRLYHNHCI